MKFPAPVSRSQARLIFLLAPPIFAFAGAAVSLMVDYATMPQEALRELRAEVFEVALWIAAVCAVGGLLFAWVQLLRYRASHPSEPDEGERLKAFVEEPDEADEPDEA